MATETPTPPPAHGDLAAFPETIDGKVYWTFIQYHNSGSIDTGWYNTDPYHASVVRRPLNPATPGLKNLTYLAYNGVPVGK